VRGDLEGQSGEGFLLVGLTNLGLFLGLRAGEEAANVADVERGGQVVQDGVEHAARDAAHREHGGGLPHRAQVEAAGGAGGRGTDEAGVALAALTVRLQRHRLTSPQ